MNLNRLFKVICLVIVGALGASDAFGMKRKRDDGESKKPNHTVAGPDAPVELGENPAKRSRTKLYLSGHKGLGLCVSEKELGKIYSRSFHLKEFFEENKILFKPCDLKESWAGPLLKHRLKHKEEAQVFITLEQLPQLLADAKSILKSFLLDDKDVSSIADSSVEKEGLNRLFTYAQLQEVITKKKLTHVRLPRKVLVVRYNNTQKYVSRESASKIIDNVLKVWVYSAGRVSICIPKCDYKFIIFAQREKHHDRGLSPEALNDLKELCLNAPFDVGYNNIFSTENGDAVIIDTEYKGEPVDSSIEKLDWYAPES